MENDLLLDRWKKYSNQHSQWISKSRHEIIGKLKSADSKILYSTTMETHPYASVFGPSQAGKTSLILELIGIKETKIDELGEILRAGRKQGNSSTSIAVAYINSDHKNFLIKSPDLNIETYCEEDHLGDKLKKIRTHLKEGMVFREPLIIGIPGRYFKKNVQKVNILDIPGVGSKTVHETKNLNNIVINFVSRSSLILVVVRANHITDLETLEIPGIGAWPILKNKSIVVQTYGFSLESIKKVFFKKTGPIKETDVDYLLTEEVLPRMKLPTASEVKYVRVDIGKSLAGLDGSYQRKIRDYNNNVFKYLRREIETCRKSGFANDDDLSFFDSLLKDKRDNVMKKIKEDITSVINRLDTAKKEILSNTNTIEQKKTIIDKNIPSKIKSNYSLADPKSITTEYLDFSRCKESVKALNSRLILAEQKLISKILEDLKVQEVSTKSLKKTLEENRGDLLVKLNNTLAAYGDDDEYYPFFSRNFFLDKKSAITGFTEMVTGYKKLRTDFIKNANNERMVRYKKKYEKDNQIIDVCVARKEESQKQKQSIEKTLGELEIEERDIKNAFSKDVGFISNARNIYLKNIKNQLNKAIVEFKASSDNKDRFLLFLIICKLEKQVVHHEKK